jgi:hypothetical protein
MMESAGVIPCADPGNEAFYDEMVARLRKEGAGGAPVNVRDEDVKKVVTKAREVFMSQPPLLELNAPINICGDIHGYVRHAASVPGLTPHPPSVSRGSKGVVVPPLPTVGRYPRLAYATLRSLL